METAVAAPAEGASLWNRLAEATDAKEYCGAWLTLLCGQIEGARAGLLLLAETASTFVPAAVWPDSEHDVGYLAEAAKTALNDKRGHVMAGPANSGRSYVAYPIEIDGTVYGAVVLDVLARSNSALQEILRTLHWGAGRLEVIFQQRLLAEAGRAQARAQIALDMAAIVGEEPRLEEAATALVNELATRLDCERVAIGLERRGRIRVQAMSHAAWFEKRGEFITSLENAMEEAVDQRRSVVFPPIDPGTNVIAVAHRDLAGDSAVCTVVLTARGKAIGALSCVRRAGVDAQLITELEAIAALAAPQLESRRELSHWFAGRMVDRARTFLRNMVDPRRPAFMAAAVLVIAGVAFLALAEGEYRVAARAVIEGEVQRAVVAPFDGFVAAAHVRAGQRVAAGQVLASLDDRDLKLEHQKWFSEREQADRKYRDALAKRERASSRILSSQFAEAEAQVALVEEKLARTQLVAPFDGYVVSGDLSQMLSSPVEKGKVLFEIAPLDAYRVILKVDEEDIRDVAPGQHGQLMLAGSAGVAMPFVVKNISVATAEEGKNVFRVEAQLDQATTMLRPGMEGVGKIIAGDQRLLWIWTHAFVDWLRLKLWRWLP